MYTDYKNTKREFRRKLRHLYIQLQHELFNDIDKAAETDQHLFCTLINRNNGRKFKLSELIVDGKTFTDPEKNITSLGRLHLRSLHT